MPFLYEDLLDLNDESFNEMLKGPRILPISVLIQMATVV